MKDNILNTNIIYSTLGLTDNKEDRKLLSRYIEQDVAFVNERKFYHYFNDIPYTRWPFYASFSVFTLLFYTTLYLNKYEFSGILSLISLLLLVYNVFGWFDDMLKESMVFGRYNKKVRKTLGAGFALFLVSEIFFFVGFFWTYFDRFFHLPAFLGSRSVPFGLEMSVWYKKPLVATLVLITSGYLGNAAHYWMKMKDWFTAVFYSNLCIALGFLFLVMQVEEYTHLLFDISDSVFGSIFYLMTGFHGFHVVVGFLFLNVQHDRLLNYHFSQERNTGYGLAMLYWHFVDIVWILLYISLYLLNYNFGQSEYPYHSYFRIVTNFSFFINGERVKI